VLPFGKRPGVGDFGIYGGRYVHRLIETSTSDDLQDWSAWQSVGSNGELASPNRRYIRYRVTLHTLDSAATPKLLDITLHDIPKAPYEKLGFASPVKLDANGAWEAVLENAYDIIVTGEVNGADTLEFKLPYSDPKRPALDNEKQVQIAGDIYRIRTLTDEKGSDGSGILTTVYAEAAFYDLTFSAKNSRQSSTPRPPPNQCICPRRYGLGIGTVECYNSANMDLPEKNASPSSA
jgi:hypothetical protein